LKTRIIETKQKSQKCTGRSRRKDLDGMGIYKEEKNL
jgi:hypothetical protein